MSTGGLELEIVTPDGVSVAERAVENVVVHRRELRFEMGSEVAVLPEHGPMLVRLAVAPVRFENGGTTVHIAVGGGFAEVLNDRVTVLTLRCRRAEGEGNAARAAAESICAAWRDEITA